MTGGSFEKHYNPRLYNIFAELYSPLKPYLFLISLAYLCCVQPVKAQSQDSWLEFEAVYSALPWYNMSGGLRQDFVYMDNADLSAKVNLDSFFKSGNSLSLFVYGLANNGGKATELVGDYQVASNIEAVRSIRLFEVWVQQNLFDDRISFLAGLYDLNSEFDVLTPGTLFINSSFGIGAEYANTGVNGPSIFPISSLGFRFSGTIGQRAKFRVAILDAVPGDPNNLKSNEIHLSKNEGALIAGEISLYSRGFLGMDDIERTSVTRRRKVGVGFGEEKEDKLNIGAWYYTSEFENIHAPEISSRGNFGAYAGFQKYFELGEKEEIGSIFMRYGIANGLFNRLGSALSGGIVLSNPFFGIDDSFGLAFSSGFNGQYFQEIQAGSERTETVLEFTYSAHIKDWLLLQPDVQYVINPSTSSAIENSLSVALLVQISITN